MNDRIAVDGLADVDRADPAAARDAAQIRYRPDMGHPHAMRPQGVGDAPLVARPEHRDRPAGGDAVTGRQLERGVRVHDAGHVVARNERRHGAPAGRDDDLVDVEGDGARIVAVRASTRQRSSQGSTSNCSR